MHRDRQIPVELIARSQAEAPWLHVAFQEQPAAEIKGLEDNNPKIVKYMTAFPNLMSIDHKVFDPKTHKMIPSGKKMGEVDETAWCSCFVAWCLRTAGQPVFGVTSGAASWLKFGFSLESPRVGAIAVVHHKHAPKAMTTSGNHVAFYLGEHHGKLLLFGGNQGDRVCAKEFHGLKVLGYRWPATVSSGALPSEVG